LKINLIRLIFSSTGLLKLFVLRPRFEKDISTRPRYGHIHVNDIKTLTSTANYMGNVQTCIERLVLQSTLIKAKQTQLDL